MCENRTSWRILASTGGRLLSKGKLSKLLMVTHFMTGIQSRSSGRAFCGFAVALSILLTLEACATTRPDRTTSGRLKRVEEGMSVKEVSRAAGRKGKPVFTFIEGGQRYLCRKFVPEDTGVPYYFLWADGRLLSVKAFEKGRAMEKVSGLSQTTDAFPHVMGYDTLLAPFEPPQLPSTIDFAALKEGFMPRNKELERAELVMWSPIILISLPFLPLTLPFTLLDHAQYAAGYEKAWRLDAEMVPEEVERRMGAPDHVLGDPATYGIWVFHHTPGEGEHIDVSVGFRSATTQWIRYGYDASRDYAGSESAASECGHSKD